MSEVESVYAGANHLPHQAVEGVSCHIGSQLLDTRPVMETVDKMLALVARLRANGVRIQHLDLGGGLGVSYKPSDNAPGIADTVAAMREKVRGHDLIVKLEPGRSIVGEAGILLTRVLYRKLTPRKGFVGGDAPTKDLLRPPPY